MILLSSVLTIILLFLLSLLMPVMSFALPVYKIKKMKDFSCREKLVANIVVMGAIAVINPMLLYFYVGFFLVIEVLYKYFEKGMTKIKKFDRIVIISIVITALMGFLLFCLRDKIDANMDILLEFYQKNFQISKVESIKIYEEMKENFIYYTFIYSILNVFVIYVSLDSDDYHKWEISFEWLLVYIVSYFMIHLLKFDNFYVINALNIGETIFIFYGIKSIYATLYEKIKYKGIDNAIAVMIGLLFPFGTFLLGVLKGFRIDRDTKKR
ncbi:MULTISPECIES: hypothetical protein [unclassified Fusobacterium]|uniref:hypothetical protein n=1 Tax=Fusobacterium sp. TaxID=68766 RepID=UPI0025BB2697|nr:hypothetical protein [Fusobacterium sp.]